MPKTQKQEKSMEAALWESANKLTQRQCRAIGIQTRRFEPYLFEVRER